MTDRDLDYEQQLKRVVEALTASVLEASDREIEEEIRAEGRDPDAEAEQLRARLKELIGELRVKLTARWERQRREREAREEAMNADGDGD